MQDEPGVLARVSGVLAARGFNIDSLIVCNTEVHPNPHLLSSFGGDYLVWGCVLFGGVWSGLIGVVGWRFVEDEYCVERSRWCC